MVIWLIGLSGVGKTTLGRAVYERWRREEPATVLVDGDEIRRMFRTDREPADYSVDGRRRNAERIQTLCAWLDRQGINVVCNILLLFPDISKWNRDNLSSYFEVYVSAPMEVLAERDSKGLYAAAARGELANVVGVDIPFDPPVAPDMRVENGQIPVDPEAVAQQILMRAREVRRAG